MPQQAHTGLRAVLSASERRAKKVLADVVPPGHDVFAQVKLSQLIEQRPPGLPAKVWDYATRASLDYVVCKADDAFPVFAVELDDASHRHRDAQRRDAMKNLICDTIGLELLRVDSHAFEPGPRGRRLVEYLIDARAYQLAFDEAQARGDVPPDAMGDYRLVVDFNSPGLNLINALGHPASLRALRLFQAGRLSEGIISSLGFSWRDGWAEAWAWLRYQPDRYLFERVKVRSYRFYCGIGPQELAQDLARAAIGDALDAAARGEPVLAPPEKLQETLARTLARRDELESTRKLDRTSFKTVAAPGESL